MSAAAPARRARKKVDAAFYVMLLPALLLFTLLIIGPALAGMFFSVTNYVGYGEYSFVGLANYLVLFTDPRILSAYGFTIGFSVVTVLLVNAIALFLAVLLNSKIKFKTALRGVFFIPMVVSGIVIAYVFNYIFSTSIPAVFGGSSILANADWAWVAVVVVTAWQAIPSALIIYLAGLLAIPEEVYEASSLDGATPWRQFTAITLPLVAGYVVINTVLGFKNFLNAYDIIVGLTNGGPGTATSSVAMTIFTGFTSGDYAYQMANAVVFFVITVLISIAQLRIINRRGVSL
ncbi:carbohydrate ABC transporter permease [Quadrisphaera setariae]|uniref:Sugar ABC transporter permease n=1 Tax=Quadrisphaera setariae TaxID=2593304 RepID=A0A5C8Z4U8_9ACTN|nr:sugar ABC transporter permease [Quadrisphaera setariae]TXR52218.1 sugar ABC transporter permease [Quadrisphaera setariae]